MATDLVSRVTTIVAVVDKATAVLRAIETRLGGLGAGGAAITGILSLQHGLDAFIETGKRLNVVHERLGITVERLQDFEHWALLAEVPTEAMDQAMGRLNRTLAQVAAGKNKEAT